MLLWKSGKQSVVTASTAEAELVEVLEGALAGDAIRVVLEEALDVKAVAVSCTDNTAAIAIVVGESGSWRTSPLRKRANILKTKVTQGDWLFRRLPGSELPADLGTKVLASEKFKQHKVNMGMFLGNEEKKKGKKEKKEDKERSFSTNAEATKQALKAIILLARMAMAKGQEENQVRLW